MKGISLILALASCAILAGPLWAESWDELRGLTPGNSIRVLDDTGKEHKGDFQASTADTITLRTANGELAIERPHVRRVQIRISQRRLRNTLIGAAIGVGVGVAVDQTLGRYLRNESNSSSRALIYAVPIGVLGGLSAIPAGYKTVYKVP